MITAIGLMVGFYILARYTEIYSTTERIGTKFCLILFSILTMLCIWVILAKDMQMSNSPW